MLSCALVALYLLLYIKLLVIDVTKAETFNTNVIFFTFALSFIKAYNKNLLHELPVISIGSRDEAERSNE